MATTMSLKEPWERVSKQFVKWEQTDGSMGNSRQNPQKAKTSCILLDIQ